VTSMSDALPLGWAQHADPETGRIFFYKAATGETSWEKPVGTSAATGASTAPLPGGWAQIVDPSSGRTFYHKGATGETSWEMPPELAETLEVQESARVNEARVAGRRGGVASQSVSAQRIQDYVKPVHPKNDHDTACIKHIIKTNDKLSLLFAHLQDSVMEDVANAFQPLEVACGHDVIRQDDNDCDRLYIINQGSVDIFVRRGERTHDVDKGTKVVSLGSGEVFGELALMYSQPRAATVTVGSSSACLWALDRDSFQMLLASNASTHLAMYEGWLREVPLFQTLNHYELARLSDCTESHLYDTGEEIVRQGELGNMFYILEDGTCSAYMDGDQGRIEVKQYQNRGEYFGEVALLAEDGIRRTSIQATGTGCSVISLTKEQFASLLGPLVEHLRHYAAQYPEYSSFWQR